MLHRYLTPTMAPMARHAVRVLAGAGLALSATLAPLAGGTPAPVAAAQQADPRTVGPTGYRIDRDDFWDFFQKRGGVRTFGYPVSRDFPFLGCTTQFFQRVILQQCGTAGVGTLNLLDGELLPYTRINGSTFPAADSGMQSRAPSPSDPDYATRAIEFVRQNVGDTFEGETVNFLSTFFSSVRLEDAFPNGDGNPDLLPLLNLELWGLPTSPPTRDPANSSFIYQRFQRGIMHYDKTTGQTQGLLLADYLKAVITGEGLPADLAEQAQSSPLFRALANASGPRGTFFGLAFQPGSGSVAQGSPSPGPSGAATPGPAQPAAQLPNVTDFAYGFQAEMYGMQPDRQSQVIGLVKNANFNWVKHQVKWLTVETSPNQYDWTQLDRIVSSASSQGVKVLLSVVDAPTFYRGSSSGLMPADNATFQRFMQTLAARYRGKVQAYELWNEQNLDREAGPNNVNPARFLELLKAGYTGTKAGDPSALALLGATSPTGANIPGSVMDDVTYLQQLYALNGGEVKRYFDALGAHPSGFAIPPDCTQPSCALVDGWNNHDSFFAFKRVAQYWDVMVKNGDAAKTIWFTEFGYDSTDQPVPGYEYARFVSEQAQADSLVRAFQKARELGYVGGMIVWNLNFQAVVPKTDEKWGFGVVRGDLSPRPAYVALKNMPKS